MKKAALHISDIEKYRLKLGMTKKDMLEVMGLTTYMGYDLALKGTNELTWIRAWKATKEICKRSDKTLSELLLEDE